LWSSFQLLGLGNPLRDAVTEEVGWVRPGKVFDVGCGAGISLDSFQALGWETSGIDISLEAVEVARSKGHTISLGDLCTAGLPEASFDVVLMSHVLEHMPSPRLALSAIRRMLRLGGYLIIEVPNLATFWTLIFRQRSWNWDLPRHFYHFTAETLRRLLDTAGFEIIKLRTKGTANYLLQSIAVSLLEKGVTNSLGDVGSPSEILQDEKLRNALAPLAEMMAQRGQGNLLRVVARRPN
jgi:2-polyprenyl-3-methyl-5-hydroxy-6-metoxy-1,4-benzoquinol methylase